MDEVRKKLEEIRPLIPANTYRTILGQMRAGNVEGAKRGIERLRKRAVGKHAHPCD